MYIPEHFAETDVDRLVDLIRSAPLGTLVVNGPEGLEANHIPFTCRIGDGPLGMLCAHLPRSNPLSGWLRGETPCLVIFSGPQGYISPSWYATKHEHGRVVPTWNYSVVHVHGSAVVVDDTDWVLEQLHELTNQNESARPQPWAVSDAPEAFTRGLISGLVGLKVAVERIEGKFKASQNQPDRNKASILEALATEQPDTALTALMRQVLRNSRKDEK